MKKITGKKIIIENVRSGISHIDYSVGSGGNLTLIVVSGQKKDADVSVHVRLAGRGASAKVIGIIIGDGSSKTAMHTMQIHEAAETTSDLLVKTVLSDHAKCLYDGGIRVEKKAQKTDAYQRNENLLLSPHAYSESKPSLEILANDVRCTHGATAGPIDEVELWYLATRGIGKTVGERLIVDGFLKSALGRIDDEKIRNQLTRRFTGAV